ncbi:hypothetical protein HUE46_06550 [Flavobacterium columnare]|nr:hypothetical protein [Flavobacterium columnare]AMO20613.2 hypothetical protein UN65_09955 [Flavobacterium columnare]ANO47141.1 hypothetical protein Pf1_01684 [Flavobacterium columnare]MEB3801587.1 hypothetical protein [Flavobacterium columnare]QOG57674.1 hypothetical protein HUE29_10035 [Flavobacterium columnare]QOG60398.1 hypothetical protein HUE30_10035 [Flavobacterium columnare]
MTTSINNKSFKIIIVLLSVLLLSSLVYIYKMSAHSKGIIVSLRSEKAELTNDLEKIKLALENTISKEGHLNKELLEEKQKVNQLLAKIEKGNYNPSEISKYKIESKNLELRIGYLMNEIERYKKKIDSTENELVASNTELKNIKKTNEDLNTNNLNLNKKLQLVDEKLNRASRLGFSNLEINAFRIKSSGEITQTNKASKTNLIKISFLISENELVPPQNKTFYYQLFDPNNELITHNETTTTGEKIEDYTAISFAHYQNKALKIEKAIPIKDPIPGIYQLKVYDAAKLILTNSFQIN